MCVCFEEISCYFCAKMPNRTAIIVQENCAQLESRSCKLSSTCRPVHLLSNRRRRVVDANLRIARHSALCLPVKQPRVHCGVGVGLFTRPAALSHKHHGVFTSSDASRVESAGKRCRETSALLQSLSDSNILAKFRRQRRDQLKIDFVENDVEYNNVSSFTAKRKVGSKSSVESSDLSLLRDGTAGRQARHSVNEDRDKAADTEYQFSTVNRRDNESRCSSHVPAYALDRPDRGQNTRTQSLPKARLRERSSSSVRRQLHPRFNMQHQQINTKRIDERFLPPAKSAVGKGFVENFTKSCNRLYKAGSGSGKSRVTRGKTVSSSASSWRELRVVGQSLLTVAESTFSRSTNFRANNTAAGQRCRSEVSGVPRQTRPHEPMITLRVVISGLENYVQRLQSQSAADPAGSCSDVTADDTADRLQLRAVHSTQDRCPGKIHV